MLNETVVHGLYRLTDCASYSPIRFYLQILSVVNRHELHV